MTRVLLLPTYGAYAATKGAVEQITRCLLRRPGPVDTELFRAGKTDEQIRQLAGLAALGRIGTPEEIADMVGLLVNPQADWVTGQNILVNGGYAA